MLILQNDNAEILMQKRPPVGIWGGLWCFPQFETDHLANEWLLENFDQSASLHSEMPMLSHTFSHFQLHIQPLIYSLKAPIKLGVMENQQWLWYNIETEFNGGLAAPVQQILNSVKGLQNDSNG